jgi:hypothetical protein
MNAPIGNLPSYHNSPLFPLGEDETTYRKFDLSVLAGSGVRV